MNISVRQMFKDDWREFRSIRLKALKSGPEVFGKSFQDELKTTEADWKETLDSDTCAVFAVLNGDNVIGMTAVAVDRNDPTNKTAILWGSWLHPDYRRKGISTLMYEPRLKWAKQKSGVEKVIVSHRESNVASKYANQKHGFKHVREVDKEWNDGVRETEVFYELSLT